MTVGIVGLGLIGGSFAKAYQEAGATVLAWNRSAAARARFRHNERRSGRQAHGGQHRRVRSCAHRALPGDHRVVSAWPRTSSGTPSCSTAAARAHHRRVLPIAKEHGVTFLGGHPMAARIRLQEREGDHVPTARRWSSCRRTLTMCCSSTTSSSCSSPRALRALFLHDGGAHDEMIAFHLTRWRMWSRTHI